LPFSIKLYTNRHCIKGIKSVQIKEQVLFKGEIITKMQKNRMGHFKNLLKNHKARNAKIYTKAYLDSANSRLYKSWSPGGQVRPHWGKPILHVMTFGKNLHL
jgi:hypothetical protein